MTKLQISYDDKGKRLIIRFPSRSIAVQYVELWKGSTVRYFRPDYFCGVPIEVEKEVTDEQ